MTVATVIWNQISLSTKMACGARNPIGDNNRLIFQVSIKPGASYKVAVTLDASDTYTVQLYKCRGIKSEVIKEIDDIYNDNLSKVIYDMCNE